jgi:4-amino-4-deoxy-L-arabinose transferase-like glycosyltransferase
MMWKQHRPVLIILLLHAALSIAFSVVNPLGEAPDEPAHYRYAQFIAKNGRPPASLSEREEAGYRATWPPLAHGLAALPIAAVGNAAPTRLKAVGDSPRRLIPTNGQTIAAFIHTAGEAWPWRGVTLAWHLARLISVAISTLAVLVTYAIALKLTRNRRLATAAAAIHAFLPQFLFVGSIVSDDPLLMLLSGLVLLIIVNYTQRDERPDFWRWLLLGAVLGLTSVTKYNALPLWGITLMWLVWHSISAPRSPATRPRAHSPIRSFAYSLIFLLLGAVLTAGWWFAFVWLNFNQVESLGLLRGSLAALIAGTSDASLRELTSGGASVTLPPPGAWLAWFGTLFKSFWGSFGGGGSINFAPWIYGLLALVTLLTGWRMLTSRRRFGSAAALFLLTPLFFLPLPLLRFALSGSLVETAQGRHLFPAISAIALGLAWGLTQADDSRRAHPLPTTMRAAALPLLLVGFSLLGLARIRASFPPLIPLHTTPGAVELTHPLAADLADGVRLAGYEFSPAAGGVLPLTLLWQATAVPPADHIIDLTVTDAAGQTVGGWLGQPVGGRYPSRAWDKGDLLRDDIPLPLLPGTAGELVVSLRLLNPDGTPTAPPIEWPAMLGEASKVITTAPGQLRADGLPPDAPFSYRGTVSFVLPGQTEPPQLIAPTGQTFAPDKFIPGGAAHFIVGSNWPSGEYPLNSEFKPQNSNLIINNRSRQFEPPPLQHAVDANFADRVTLLGYDLPQRRVEPGQSFPLTLHLQANRTMGENLAIFNHLLDASAVQRGGADRIPQNFYTTLLWVPGEIVSDGYAVPVDANAPPGVYWLDVGLYPTAQPSLSLPLVVDGQVIDRNSVSIGPLKVGGPPPDVTVATATPQTPLNVLFGEEIVLLGFDQTEAESSTLTLYWQAETTPQNDYTVFVHFLDEQGNLAAQADGPPAGGVYPSSLWDAGEIVVDSRPLPAMPPGQYSVWAGLYRPDNGERLPTEFDPGGAARLLDIQVPPGK